MKVEELSSEQIERAKECKTTEERMAFIAEYKLKLSDEQLDAFAGGFVPEIATSTDDACPATKDGQHFWEETGRTRPGRFFGDYWPDKEIRCCKCGRYKWRL